MPTGRKLSLLAYLDKTPDGFGAVTDYTTYAANHFATTPPLKADGTYDFENGYDRRDLVFITTGEIGNTNSTENRGFEADFDFGTVKPLRTQFLLSGAWQETKTWSTNLNSQSVKSALLPSSYSSTGLTPFKIVYPSGEDYSKYRRFVTTLRTVTHIPELRMVASLTAQAIWQNWSTSYVADKDPIAWIDDQLVRHELSASDLNGYIYFDNTFAEHNGVLTNRATFYDALPANAAEAASRPQSYVALKDLLVRVSDNEPQKTPVTWNLQARLTKELGTFGGLSFYVNNALYYEPYLKGNTTTTLVQRNVGFSFGAELYLNL